MSRFSTAQLPSQERSSKEQEDGDAIFIGMDMKTPKEYLQPGVCSLSINKRLSDGRAVTRPGTVMPKFANAISFGTILGSGLYNNPNGISLLLVATPNNVYGIHDGTYPIVIPVSATLSGTVTFDQNFNEVYLNNASITLVWDGVSSTGFVPNVQQNPLD